MISPTGKGIRYDVAGDGSYGARRSGGRLHKGVDYLCDEGQGIYAPFDMTITRKAYPNRDMVMQGIAWKTKKNSGRIFYFEVDKHLIGKKVKQGEVIGTAQSVSKYYDDNRMMDHVHFQIN